MTETRFRSIRDPAPRPTPDSGVTHGVCLASTGGVIVTAQLAEGVATAVRLQRFPANLAPIAAEVRKLLEADPGSRAVLDRGLRGRELHDHIDWPREQRRQLQLFEAVAEDRRYEVAGRLTHALESGKAKIRRSLFDLGLRQALNAATREDAGDRPEVVALSLAVVNRRPPVPHIA